MNPRRDGGKRKPRLGTILMLVFAIGWISTMLTVQFTQAYIHGYGSGFGDGGRMPPDVVKAVGVGNDRAAVMAATNQRGSDGGPIEDGVRLIGSVAALLGIIGFWYLVMSRSDTF